MRLRTFLLSFLFCLGIAGFADEAPVIEPSVLSSDPHLESTGGGSVAHPFAIQAIRLNPAAFSADGSFELSGAGGLAVGPQQLLETGEVLFSGPPLPGRFAQARSGEVTSDGFGFAASLRLGYTGNNIGLGFTSDYDVFMSTNEDSESRPAEGHLISETALVAGLALPFSLGDTSVSVGAAVRPFIRVRGELDDRQAMEAFAGGMPFEDAFADTPVLNGGGLAMDAGILVEHDPFSVGFAVRNIGDTRVAYREHSLAEVLDAAAQGRFPDGGGESGELYEPDKDYVLPMTTRLGVAWNPGWSVVDPTVFADMQDPHLFGVGGPNCGSDSGGCGDRPLLSERFSAGVNLEVAGMFSVRAGASRDGVAVGAGVGLGPLHLDSSVRVLGQRREHATVGAALRF